MPTWSSSSTARARRRRAAEPELDAQRLGDLVADRVTGFRQLIGSWKIIAISRPRIARSSPPGSPSRSRPSNRAPRRRSTRPGSGTSPSSERQVTLLPEPDSPTSPIVSPAREREADAGGGEDEPVRRRERGVRLRTSSSGRPVRRASAGSSATARIIPSFSPALPRQPVPSRSARPSPTRLKPTPASTITRPGQRRDPPGGEQEGLAVGDHQAPFGRRRLHAEAEERERGEHEDVEHDVEHREDEVRPDHVREDVPEHDPRAASSRGSSPRARTAAP